MLHSKVESIDLVINKYIACSISHCSKVLAALMHEFIQKKGLDTRSIIKKLINKPIMLRAIPYYVVKRRTLLQYKVVYSKLRSTWKDLKYGHSKDHYSARNVLVAIVVSVESSNSCTRVAS